MRGGLNALKTALFTWLVPAIIAWAIPQVTAREAHVVAESTRIAADLLIALGTFVYLWCAAMLFVCAQRTPAPASPPKRPVIRGPYRINRNPMYAAVLVVIPGQAGRYRSLILAVYGGLLLVFFHLFVMLYEEPTLKARFNRAYEDFCRQVPRWVPRR